MKRAVLAAAALLAVLPPAGRADTPSGITLTPAKVEADLGSRSVDLGFTVANHENDARTLDLSIAGLIHDLDGVADYPPDTAAARALRTDVSTVTLAPGEERRIHVAGGVPAGPPSLYAGLVVVIRPQVASPGQVSVTNRLAAPMLIRVPRPWVETAEVVTASVHNTAPGQPAVVEAVVKDTGNVHIRPSGTARIFRDGQLLATVALPPETILPGLARRLGVSWRVPAGVNGPLTIEVTLDHPRASGRVDVLYNATAFPATGTPESKGPPGLNRSTGPSSGILGSRLPAPRAAAGGLGAAAALAVGLLALVVVGLGVFFFAVRRRRGEEDEPVV